MMRSQLGRQWGRNERRGSTAPEEGQQVAFPGKGSKRRQGHVPFKAVWRLESGLLTWHEDMDLIEQDSNGEPRTKGPRDHQKPKESQVLRRLEAPSALSHWT